MEGVELTKVKYTHGAGGGILQETPLNIDFGINKDRTIK
jgi:hypothetical protein